MRMTAAGAALFGAALLVPAVTEAQNGTKTEIPGFLDTSTGLFTARPVQLPAATLQRSGTITVTVTAVLGSNIPGSVPVSCSVSISSSDSAADNRGSASGVLARSGKGGTCKIAIPYIFEVASGATTMTVSAEIFAVVNPNTGLNYDAFHSFTPFVVPNGNKSLTVTLAM
jgi:hypothetical protein